MIYFSYLGSTNKPSIILVFFLSLYTLHIYNHDYFYYQQSFFQFFLFVIYIVLCLFQIIYGPLSFHLILHILIFLLPYILVFYNIHLYVDTLYNFPLFEYHLYPSLSIFSCVWNDYSCLWTNIIIFIFIIFKFIFSYLCISLLISSICYYSKYLLSSKYFFISNVSYPESTPTSFILNPNFFLYIFHSFYIWF